MKELAELNAIYQEMSAPDVDEAMIVTNADKKGNTPAYQGYKAGKKNVKTGKPLYKAADHLKDDKDWGYDNDGNSLNPVDIEKKKKKAKKDHDGDGKVESGKEEYFGSKDKAIKKAMSKEEAEYNYVNQYLENAPRMQKGAMAYDGPNKAASEAKDRILAKTKAKRKGPKPTVTIDKPDKLVSIKIKESGIFSEEELSKLLWMEFDESILENRQVAMEPEKHKDPDESDKPYHKRSKAARMRDPEKGINSPAFKKFMADRGM